MDAYFSMANINCPHDKFFKSAMADMRVAREFFEHHLPECILKTADFSTLQLQPNSYIDPQLNLTSSDILYKIKIAGNEGYFYLLCEHQSSSDPLMPFRLWQYKINIWADYLKHNPNAKKLPLIVPLVFYHGKYRYKGSRDLKDIIEAPKSIIEEVLFKPFRLIDTHDIADEKLREQHWSGVMTFVMKNIYARNILNIKSTLFEMLRFIIKEYGEGAYNYSELLLCYIFNSGNLESPVDFIEEIKKEFPPKVGEQVMTGAEWFRELGVQQGMQQGIQQGMHQGIQQGIQQGMHQGIQQGMHQGIQQGMHQGMQQGMQLGESKMLFRLIEKKFGVLPLTIRVKIEKASDMSLLNWSNRLLEVDSLEELFEE